MEASLHPALGTTYMGQGPAFLERVLPLVDYLEVTPDTVAVLQDEVPTLHGPTMAELQNIGARTQVIVHGVGLSIGSHDGYWEPYLRLLDQFVEQVEVAWHSEHLGYTMVDGEHLGTMLALPRTEEVLDLLCERVSQIQRRYRFPFLLENIVSLLPVCEGEYSQAGFLNAIAARTGCGLLLDVYNLECDAYNHALDIAAFLAELDMERIQELHVARGVLHRGMLLDVHSQLTHDSTIACAQNVLTRASDVRVVTYELLPEALPVLGHDAIVGELTRLVHAFTR